MNFYKYAKVIAQRRDKFLSPFLDTGDNVGLTGKDSLRQSGAFACLEVFKTELDKDVSEMQQTQCSCTSRCLLGTHAQNRWMKTVKGWERAARGDGHRGGNWRVHS